MVVSRKKSLYCLLFFLLLGLFVVVNEVMANKSHYRKSTVQVKNSSSTDLLFQKVTPKWVSNDANNVTTDCSTSKPLKNGDTCKTTLIGKSTKYGHNGGGDIIFFDKTGAKRLTIYFHSYTKWKGKINHKCIIYLNGKVVRNCYSYLGKDATVFKPNITDADLQ